MTPSTTKGPAVQWILNRVIACSTRGYLYRYCILLPMDVRRQQKFPVAWGILSFLGYAAATPFRIKPFCEVNCERLWTILRKRTRLKFFR